MRIRNPAQNIENRWVFLSYLRRNVYSPGAHLWDTCCESWISSSERGACSCPGRRSSWQAPATRCTRRTASPGTHAGRRTAAGCSGSGPATTASIIHQLQKKIFDEQILAVKMEGYVGWLSREMSCLADRWILHREMFGLAVIRVD